MVQQIVVTNSSEVFVFKIMKVVAVIILFSAIIMISFIMGFFAYGILIAVALIVLYLIFRKKKRKSHFKPRWRHSKYHRYHRHKKFRRR